MSATLDRGVEECAKFICPEAPVRISLGGVAKSIEQYYVDCGAAASASDTALDVLLDLQPQFRSAQAIVFANKTYVAERLARVLRTQSAGPDEVGLVHSGMEQWERTRVLQDFTEGQCKILVATDVIGRGFDTQRVGWVIQAEIPWDAASYLHRISRTGRCGRRGIAVSLVPTRDLCYLEKYSRTQGGPGALPMPDPSSL